MSQIHKRKREDREATKRLMDASPSPKRFAKVQRPTPGVCWVCGYKIAKTETICGECACEDEGCE